MPKRSHAGFTLIELMIVVVIIGILAAIGVPNFIAMQDRAKEANTKANMHSFQLSAEDYGVQHDGIYADDAADVVTDLPGSGLYFKNPFDQSTGLAGSWENRASLGVDPTGISGLVSYADSAAQMYNIKGVGKKTSGAGFPLALVLSAGQ
jgi:prepilin-type N-terminal cleavage/methylation domain-containing protein